MKAEAIAKALQRARRSGSGWIACCPAHEDRNPSLSIADSGNGSVLVNCHAHCSQENVIRTLRDAGLWPEREQPRDPIVAEYDYRDARGELLYQVVRLSPKRFLQRYPNAHGWVWKKHPAQILYRLGEVLESPIVMIVEGEKDVETLRSYGFTATTNAGGCSAQWLESFTETLRGREIIIIPDNDAPGWKRAAVIARALLGQASRIVVLDLPRETKDISDWFAAGHTETELIALLDGVHAH